MEQFYKIGFFFGCLLIAVITFSQPKIIYYGNDSLLINETLIKGNISKEQLDNIMQSKSRNGVIIKTLDLIINITETERQRYFGYSESGIIYKPFIKNSERFTLSVRLEFEGDEQKQLKKQTFNAYTGLLMIGSQFINKESTVEKILVDPSFSLIKKGDKIINKRRVIYALLSFQNILIKLYYDSENGHLKMVELNK